MSGLSEAEKRKLLRERRQKKFSGGGGSDRLNKITGQADSLMSTKSTIDLKAEDQKSNIKSKKNSESSDSPRIVDHSPQASFLKHLAEKNSQNGFGSPSDLISMLQSMTADDTKNSTMSGFTGSSRTVDQSLLDYHNYRVNKLKAYFITIKWIFLVPYMYVVTHDLNLNQPVGGLLDSCNFFSVLMGFEVVTISLYYNRLQSIEKDTNINSLANDSKISRLISLIPNQSRRQKSVKFYLFILLQYWDVISMLITDICFILVVLGIFTHT